MKKKGFTLAELLVALSIVAIASALMAPAFTNIMPDKYKLRVLQYHTMIANATNSMLENEAIYYGITAGNSTNCIGLECDAQPLIAPYNNPIDRNNFSGVNKYRNILADMLGLEQSGNDYATPEGTIWNINTIDNVAVVNDWTTTITLTFDSKDTNTIHSMQTTHHQTNLFSELTPVVMYKPGMLLQMHT